MATVSIIGGIVAAMQPYYRQFGFSLCSNAERHQANKLWLLAEPVELETEEGKILKLLKSSGGSMRQSAIVDQCRFSKAKTSQLLAVLEKNGNITRYKKGRDKIVNLTERVKNRIKW